MKSLSNLTPKIKSIIKKCKTELDQFSCATIPNFILPKSLKIMNTELEKQVDWKPKYNFFSELRNILKYKKSLVFITSFSFLVLYSISSESKGYLLLFLLSILPNLIIAINKSQYRKYIFLAIIPTTLVLSTIFVNLYDNIVQQFYTSITFGTRFSSYIASLRVSVLHPFGVGLGPYVYYYTESIRTVLDTGLMSAFNLNEIKGYLSTTTALSTKTYFFNQLMFGGIGFLIFYYHFFYKRYRKLTKNPSTGTLKVIFIFIILSGIIYITYHIKYEIWIFLAIIDYLETNKGYKIVKNEK